MFIACALGGLAALYLVCAALYWWWNGDGVTLCHPRVWLLWPRHLWRSLADIGRMPNDQSPRPPQN